MRSPRADAVSAAAGCVSQSSGGTEAWAMTTTVTEIMSSVVVAVREQACYKEIVTAMRRRHVSGLPVLDESDQVIGLVSEADLLLKEAFPDAIHKPGRSPWRGKKLTKAGAGDAAEALKGPAGGIKAQ